VGQARRSNAQRDLTSRGSLQAQDLLDNRPNDLGLFGLAADIEMVYSRVRIS
jgi:hypothetical protein